MNDASPSSTLVSLFCRRIQAGGDRAAILFRRGEDALELTWNQLARDVHQAAAALAAQGVRPGDRVVQVSENRYEWLVLDLAVHLARGIHVAIHSILAGPQIVYQIVDSGARLVVVSTADQARKLAAEASHLPQGITYFSHEPCQESVGATAVRSWPAEVARADAAQGERLAGEALAAVQPDDLATILYTSGTTGEPKGVMLSHGNLASNALAAIEEIPQLPDDLRLCWLPLSHIFARTADLYIWLAAGTRLALARGRDTVLADCAFWKPTLMNGVPYFFDKVARYLQEQGRADEPGALLALLGGQMRACCSGGAALPDHAARFFCDRGVPLFQGYGLTESSPIITMGSPTFHRLGTAGRILPGVEVRIAEDGEILTRGPHVMQGYWNKPQATAETIRDGWLHTGDLGELQDGYLRITGRKKELIVTAAGKNIAPTLLEGLLIEDPLIAQAIVIGDGRNFLAALIVPDRALLEAELSARGIPAAPYDEALGRSEVVELFAERIRRRLKDVSSVEQIGKFMLVPFPFTVEREELTPTLKLRRGVIFQHYAEAIEAMYRK